MIRYGMVILVIAMAAVAVTAREPGQLHWQPGQVLIYRAEHNIQITEIVGTDKSESKSRLNVTKRWQVTGVDAAGVATVQLSLLRLRNEITKPDGEVLVFDSADPKTPEDREQHARYVGPVLAVLRVDPRGQVIEVSVSKFGPASRFQTELPFVGILPGTNVKPGNEWDRAYEVVLEPPQGTGEKFAAKQHYRCTGIVGSLATVALTTVFKTLPKAAADQVPLAQSQPTGEIVFDLRAGRMHSATLKVDQEIKGHQGEGSSYHFQSSYNEQYVGDR